MGAGEAGSVSSATEVAEVAEPVAESTACFLPAMVVEASLVAARARS
jgi:hypothetical protein